MRISISVKAIIFYYIYLYLILDSAMLFLYECLKKIFIKNLLSEIAVRVIRYRNGVI